MADQDRRPSRYASMTKNRHRVPPADVFSISTASLLEEENTSLAQLTQVPSKIEIEGCLSPDPDAKFGREPVLVAFLDAEGFIEFGEVLNHAVAAELGGGVRIDGQPAHQ